MRIDAKSTLGGYPVLQVRKLVRALNNRLYWDSKTVQAVFSVELRKADDLVRALEASGLAKIRRGKGPKAWTTTPACAIIRFGFRGQADHAYNSRNRIVPPSGTNRSC